MFSPKKVFSAFISLLLAVFSFLPQPLLAFQSQSKYFDYGPYYSSSQVLGFSFSNLENLPALQLPDSLNLPSATGVLPDSPFYPFEKAIEGTQLAFTFDPVKKAALRLDFASERLVEAKTMMDQGKAGSASRALDDYGKTLNGITDSLPSLAGRNDPPAQNLISKVEETVSAQTLVAAALSLASDPARAESWTGAGNAGRDALDKVAEVKNEPAIPESLSTGLQSLKEQGFLSEEEANKIYSLKNRGQVREELNKLTASGFFPPSEIIKLDDAVGRYYPEAQNQQIANSQIMELRSYQTLPQPGSEVMTELQKWQQDPTVPPSNDIKPYLWYNRAQDLAKEVNLSNFSPDQQSKLVELYPRPVIENPTYSPPPSPVPSSAPTVSPSPVPANSDPASSPAPSPTPPAAKPYLKDAEGPLPGQPTYFIKQLGEGFNLAFTFDPADRARFRMEAAERRLVEAEALSSDPKKSAFYETALKNYQSAVTDASKSLEQIKNPEASRRVAQALEAQASRHEVVFEKGLLPTPPKNPQLLSEIIKVTEDALDKSADTLNRPAVPPTLASRLDDLKAQGLILPEEADDLVRSGSREQVRGKIRKLVELKTFPLADAKKMDEAQIFTSPADYNQLVEVRKVEELQNLRSVQTDLAQTPTLRSAATNLGRKETALTGSIDPALIRPEDLTGRDDLIKTYQKLSSAPRPINSGQFGPEATPGAQITTTPLRPADAVLSTCPEGAEFKQFEGCVWSDTGKKLNDYDQYKCDGPRQYYSFAARKCVAYDDTTGFRDDAQPVCPVGYTWNWQAQSCQVYTRPLPSPSAEPEPVSDQEIAERSKSCPEGSSYQAPNGCVWDKDGKAVYDSSKYRCNGRGQYYSFEQQKCVASPKPGEPYPDDTTPSCKEAGAYWSWTAGKCIQAVEPLSQDGTGASRTALDDIQPNFVTPDSPFYFLKQAGESLQLATAFSNEAREQVKISQARERLTEGYWALQKGRTTDFTNALSAYTTKLQELNNDLSKANLSETGKRTVGEKLAKEAAEQNLILQKIEVLAKDDAAAAISAASSAVLLGMDKAADLRGEAPIPDEVKKKLETLPEQMITEEDKKKLLETSSRVEVRLKLGEVTAKGGLTAADTAFLNEDFESPDANVKLKINELKKLEDIANTTDQKEKLEERIEKNEDIVSKLAEFQKDFQPGKDVPAELRPYVRLSRIEEIAQTIRPDMVKLEDFQNRKDVVLAVATLQEEFKPTRESFRRIEEFRRRNPNVVLPPDLARVEALSYSLGVRNQAESCFLPTPPFPANTPCPPPGAAIQIASYYAPAGSGYGSQYGNNWYGGVGGANQTGSGAPGAPSTDKDGNPLVYGQGPKSAGAGVCPDGYHWMYDSGGWCMSNSGNYSSNSNPQYGGGGPGYTPYSPYYTAPGAPVAGSAYPPGSYAAPSYYGSAPTYYTTNPPAGTVPGSGPQPTAPGQCPSGFHWMPPSTNQAGWCMSDAPTYVPSGSNYYSPNLTQSSCGPGYYWDGRGCIPTSPGDTPSSSSNYYSPGSYQYGCTPGNYWDGSKCVAGSNEGSGWSDTAARSQSWCQPPSGSCGSNSYWDYGSCSCRASSTYYGGSGTSGGYSGSSCSPPAGGCGSGWWDSGSCSCKQSSSQGCYNVSASSCGSGWYFDSAACTCRQSSTSGSTSTSTSGSSGSSSSGSCPSGSHWMSENGGYCMSDAARDAASSGGSSGGSSSSGSCPSGYHWMDNSWCMQDGAGSTSTSSTPTTTTTSPAPTTSEPAPAPPPSEPAPAPASEPAPAPSP